MGNLSPIDETDFLFSDLKKLIKHCADTKDLKNFVKKIGRSHFNGFKTILLESTKLKSEVNRLSR